MDRSALTSCKNLTIRHDGLRMVGQRRHFDQLESYWSESHVRSNMLTMALNVRCPHCEPILSHSQQTTASRPVQVFGRRNGNVRFRDRRSPLQMADLGRNAAISKSVAQCRLWAVSDGRSERSNVSNGLQAAFDCSTSGRPNRTLPFGSFR
jgi:hypothetical protein